MLDFSTWIQYIMHAAVGLVSVFALMTLACPSYLPSFLFSDPNPNRTKLTNSRRNRKRRGGQSSSNSPETFIYGLVNSGNTCFLNSVLQALASSYYLKKFLVTSPIIQKQLDKVELDFEPSDFPVTEALHDTVSVLNQLVDHPVSAYPTEVVSSLRTKMRITTYEQQDAQEFFQILSDALNEEENIVVQTCRNYSLLDADVLKSLIDVDNNQSNSESSWPNTLSLGSAPNGRRDPLHGLLASRLSCVQCGYTAAIRHFAFNNISLSLPFRASCTLEECLQSYITIESLQDVVCRKCSLRATLAKYEAIQAMSKHKKGKQNGIKPKQGKKDTLNTQHIRELSEALSYNIEGDLSPEIKVERAVSHHSTKQVMFAKPPQVLCLHLNRSAYFPNGAVTKNMCQVKFPELLDLSRFCTTGHLVLGPQSPLSMPDPANGPHPLYRLQAVIVHYGSHSYGHFVTFRRKPLSHDQEIEKDILETTFDSSSSEWFQVSDQSVLPADVMDVLSSNPYMLLYEAIPSPPTNSISSKLSVSHLETNLVPGTTRRPSQSPSPSSSSSGPPTPPEIFASAHGLLGVESQLPLSSPLLQSSQPNPPPNLAGTMNLVD